MRRPALAALLLLPLAALALSGCLNCASGPPVTARGIGPDTDASAGLTGFELRVLVTEEPGGPPLPGAGVVLYWARDDPAEWAREGGGRVEVGEDGMLVVAEPGALPRTPDAKSTLRLRADESGRVVARVPPERVVGLVAAAEGWTEEWVPGIATGARGSGEEVTLALYRAELSTTVEGTWGPGGASTGRVTGNNYLWKADALPFGESESARRGYAARLAALDARLSWENGVNGVGDLAIGLGPAPEQPAFVHDETTDASPGAQAEAFSLVAGDLARHASLGRKDLYVGPASRTGYAGPLGLPYALALTATFDPAAVAQGGCGVSAETSSGGLPGASVPLPALAGVAGLAIAGFLLAPRKPRTREEKP